ncbi:MAG: succinate dehydrogenase, hydrophobic membrane anchor protein [Caulobacterales bacterium]|jgi:succinate dehydrogenase / fumarate reductase membrane anchor subunit|nr:succinate dehydrogenase, hydrophobic membrane anchor protein [Caulobacterales bacterium]
MSKDKSTPLGRVRNHGAAAEGTGHFVGQRVSAIALLFVATWFVLSAALSMDGPTYLAAIDFISQPFNAVGLILLIMVALYHMRLGMGEVVNDYVHKPFAKMALLLLNTLVPLVIAAGAIFAVLLVNFGV